MSGREQVNATIRRLRAASAAIRCRDLIRALESLGFEVRDGGKQGHKVFVHDGLEGFLSAAFTCGHGRNPEIKKVYVKKVIKLLEQYEEGLIRYLGEQE